MPVALNLALWYNTLLWGQYDAIPLFFVTAAIALAFTPHAGWALPCMLLAVFSKLQMAIFVPPLLVLLATTHPLRRLVRVPYLTSLVVLPILIWLPFITKGHFTEAFLTPWTRGVDFYPNLSLHAYNLWYIITPGDPYSTSDKILMGGLSAKTWGLALFCTLSGLLIWKLFMLMRSRPRSSSPLHSSSLPPYSSLPFYLLTLALINFFFFFFCTQMHERYIHPAVWFASGAYMLTGRWWSMAVLSVAYVCNMEGVSHTIMYILQFKTGWPGQVPAHWVMPPLLNACIFGLAGCMLFMDWIRAHNALKQVTPEWQKN